MSARVQDRRNVCSVPASTMWMPPPPPLALGFARSQSGLAFGLCSGRVAGVTVARSLYGEQRSAPGALRVGAARYSDRELCMIGEQSSRHVPRGGGLFPEDTPKQVLRRFRFLGKEVA